MPDVNRLTALENEVERLRLKVKNFERELEDARTQRDEFMHLITAHRAYFEARRIGDADGQ